MRTFSSISLLDFDKDDERILSPAVHSFVFTRGATTTLDFLTFFSEVFGRNQLRVRTLSILPTDLLGETCCYCNEQISTPDDLTLIIKRNTVQKVVHESCFRHWFLKQDKRSISPYRFSVPAPATISCYKPFTGFVKDSKEYSSPMAVTLLDTLDFNDIAAPNERAATAEITQALENRERPGLNIFFCPRCNATIEISFLETEERIHTCTKCRGRFRVIVKEV